MPSRPLLRRTLLLLVTTILASGTAVALQGTATASPTQVLQLSAKPNMVLRFNRSRLSAHPGRVKLVMFNPRTAGMAHGIAIRGNGVEVSGSVVGRGGVSSVTAQLKTGRYEYYDPVAGSTQPGLHGTLIVSS